MAPPIYAQPLRPLASMTPPAREAATDAILAAVASERWSPRPLPARLSRAAWSLGFGLSPAERDEML
jgi:hypothetical protein